jgi:hypothetical protein
VLHGAADVEQVVVEVDVRPPQATQLAEARSGDRRQDDRHREDGVLLLGYGD